MRFKILSRIVLLITGISILATSTSLACTGVYVGKDVSVDGSVMIARTEDIGSANSKRFIVHPAKDYLDGEMYTDVFNMSIPYPSHTYRYTATPASKSRGLGDTPYGAAGFNELGVAATSTITAYPNDKAISTDPFVETGLHELSANDIILSRATSARHGIEIIAEIVDNYGSGEGNIIMTADKDEAWYMEIYTGHQYAAIKMPTDKAAVIPNSYMLGEIDVESPDVIVSENLVKLAKENGFYKEENGNIHLRKTYSEKEKDTNSLRIWGGRRLLHGDVGDDAYKTEYELFFTPKEKIKIKDVMDVSRTRYEDTKYFLGKPGNKYLRSIATARQEECHILQIRPDLPQEIACVEWLTLGNAEFAPYLPYYASALTQTPEICTLDASEYSEHSMYWANRSLSTISALDRALFGNKIKEFYSEYENKLIANMTELDKKMMNSTAKSQTANELCYNVTYDAFNKSKALYAELIEFIALYEGEDETKGSKLPKFEIKLKPEIEEIPSYTTTGMTTITE